MDTNPRVEPLPRFERYRDEPDEPWHRSPRARLFGLVETSALGPDDELLPLFDCLNQALNNAIEEEAKTRVYLDTPREAITQGAAVVPQGDRPCVESMPWELGERCPEADRVRLLVASLWEYDRSCAPLKKPAIACLASVAQYPVVRGGVIRRGH